MTCQLADAFGQLTNSRTWSTRRHTGHFDGILGHFADILIGVGELANGERELTNSVGEFVVGGLICRRRER